MLSTHNYRRGLSNAACVCTLNVYTCISASDSTEPPAKITF